MIDGLRRSVEAGFNPRAREGRDEWRCYNVIAVNLFQSTRPRGARQDGHKADVRASKFQSTRPRGARRQSSRNSREPIRFNPRAREGRDQRPLNQRMD